MLKKLLLSFCFLLSQVLTVSQVQAQEYPGFKSWNEFVREYVACNNDTRICLPFKKRTPYLYWLDFKCSNTLCLDSTGKIVVASTSEELEQVMLSTIIEFKKQHPERQIQINYLPDNSLGEITYLHDGNRYNLEWGPTPFIVFDISCNFLEGFECPDSNLDRTSMSDAPCDICSKIGNPFDVRNGAKYEQAVDIDFPIALSRNYSSKQRVAGLLGKNWRTNFDKTLKIIKNNNIITSLIFTTPTAEYVMLQGSDGVNFNALFPDQKKYKVKIVNNTIQLTRPDSGVEIYNATTSKIMSETSQGRTLTYQYYANGLLENVSDSFGRNIQFSYNSSSFVNLITASNGDRINYSYYEGNISNVKHNNINQISYEYYNNLLTAKLDGNSVKYASFTYDDKGRGIENKWLTSTGQEIKKYTLSYDENNTKVVQDNGFSRDYTMAGVNYAKKITNMSGNGVSEEASFDSNGNGMWKKDVNGAHENYSYDDDGRISSYMKDTKTINLSWDAEKNLTTQTTENTGNGTRTTNYLYDANNNEVGYQTTGNNVQAYVYKIKDIYGRITREENEQGLIKTYTYKAIGPTNDSGLLNSIVSNAGSRFVINSYDTRGNPASISVNGVTKTMTYDYKGRILTETVNGATNSYTYDVSGNLITSHMANGYQMTNTYDSANRLLSITDNMDGSVVLTTDDYTGEVLKTQFLQNNALVRERNKLIDTLGRTLETWNATARTKKSNSYYTKANLPDNTTDANGIVTNYSWNMTGDNTAYSTGVDNANKLYDVEGKLTSISVNNQTTNMSYDDLGRFTTINSPDTDYQTYTYSKAKDTYTDAKNTVHTTYKAANGLVTSVTHVNTDSEVNYNDTETYAYDNYGRLNKITNAVGETDYTINALGQLTTKKQTNKIAGTRQFSVQYGYNSLGQKTTDTYPSGLVVTYGYTKGFVTSILVNGMPIVSNVNYNSMLQEPTSWTLGGRLVSVVKDTDGLLTSFEDSGIMNQVITTDNEGHILSVADSVSNNNFNAELNDNYALTGGVMNGKGLDYEFTDNHNLSSQKDGITDYLYELKLGSNKIRTLNDRINNVQLTYGHDDNGNLRMDGKGQYQYDSKNNLDSSFVIGIVNGAPSTVATKYYYNALNQRVAKFMQSGQIRYFVYNESNQVIGEYDSAGIAIAEYVYFGLRPVAVKTGGSLNIVHTDYLTTPRMVTSGTNGGSMVWEWRNDNPYGNNKAQGSIEFNLRFAGQYYDSETGLHYNINRTYNPATGRYLQSDPIGLAGGFNTYNYVNKNPLNGVDPLGLRTINYGLIALNYDNLENLSFFLEGAYKVSNDMNNSKTLTLLSHGSMDTLHGMDYIQLANEIIKGEFNTDNGLIKDNYFIEKLKSGEDIHIILNACDTGIQRYGRPPIIDGSSYANDLANLLKFYLNKNGYGNKIIIEAPSGAAIGLSGVLNNLDIRDIVVKSNRGDAKESNGKWEKIIK